MDTKKLIFILIAAAACLTGCQPKTDHLTVGMELSYPPFEMTDPQGRPSGVSVDLANAFGQFIGRHIEIENIPFDGLIPALQTHKIDLIISSMTATPARAEAIGFSDAYLTTGLCLLVGKDSPIQSIADVDVPGRTIVVKKGTTGHVYSTTHIQRARVLALDKEDACVLEVIQKKADAFIYDQISTYENWSRNQETTRALLKPFQVETWAVGVRRDDTNLVGQVNQFLHAFKAQGGFDQLGGRYLKDQKEAFRKLGYPFYF